MTEAILRKVYTFIKNYIEQEHASPVGVQKS